MKDNRVKVKISPDNRKVVQNLMDHDKITFNAALNKIIERAKK